MRLEARQTVTTIYPEKARDGARFCHRPHPAVCYGNKVIKRNVGPVGAKNCISSLSLEVGMRLDARRTVTTIYPEKAREGARFCHRPHPAVCYSNKVIKRNVGPVGAQNCIPSLSLEVEMRLDARRDFFF